MQIGIALLLRGGRPDHNAATHALEMARRTGCVLHVVALRSHPFGGDRDTEAPPRPAPPVSPAHVMFQETDWCGERGIRIQFHLLDSYADESLARFIAAHRIRLLICGIAAAEETEPLLQQAARLGTRLGSEQSAHLKTLWSILVAPGDGEEYGPIVMHAENVVWQNTA